MTGSHPDLMVYDNQAESRYEVKLDGEVGMIVYRLRGATIDLTHTEVPNALEGRGIASAMTRYALDDARARSLRVRPLCPFVADYIKRHPEYADLVTA